MRLQRDTLTERLRITTAFERQQREAFQQDVYSFTAAVHSFFSRLERYLPGRVGGEALEPQLSGGVLFAVNPALRVNNVATGASSVTVHLKGPTRFALAGVDIAVTGSPLPSLYVNGQDHRLQPRLRLSVDGATLVAIHESNYLHLNVRDEVRSLAALTAEALAVYYVLSSPRRTDLLRVLRAAANVATGDPQSLVGQALGRLRELRRPRARPPPSPEGLVERFRSSRRRQVGRRGRRRFGRVVLDRHDRLCGRPATAAGRNDRGRGRCSPLGRRSAAAQLRGSARDGAQVPQPRQRRRRKRRPWCCRAAPWARSRPTSSKRCPAAPCCASAPPRSWCVCTSAASPWKPETGSGNPPNEPGSFPTPRLPSVATAASSTRLEARGTSPERANLCRVS